MWLILVSVATSLRACTNTPLVVLSNLSEQEKTAKEIEDIEKVLAEAFSKLSCLRCTQ